MGKLKHAKHLIVVIALAAFMASLLLWMGRGDRMPKPSPDSSYYVSKAHSFLHGDGFRSYFTRWDTPPDAVPSQDTHFPPGLPLLFAGMEAVGMQPRGHDLVFVHVILLFITLVSTGILVYQLTGSGVWGGLGVLLTMSSYFVIYVHLHVYSEPLFITTLMLGTLFLATYLRSSRWIHLLAAALFYGLMWLTRYAGVGFVPQILVIAALAHHLPVRERVRKALAFTGLLFLPQGIWFVRNVMGGERSASGHTLSWESLSENIDLLLTSFKTGFSSAKGIWALALIALTLLLFTLWQGYQSARPQIQKREWLQIIRSLAGSPLFLVFALWAGYWAFVFLGGTVANFIVDVRKFAPAYPLLVVWLTGAAYRFAHTELAAGVRIAVAVPLFLGLIILDLTPGRLPFGLSRGILILSVLAVSGAAWWLSGLLADQKRAGIVHALLAFLLTGFITAQLLAWVEQGEDRLQQQADLVANSELFGWVRENVDDQVVYTNEWERVYYNLGDLDNAHIKDLPREDRQESVDAFTRQASASGGYIVFSEHRHRVNLYSEETLTAPDYIVLLHEFEDGRVYQILPEGE